MSAYPFLFKLFGAGGTLLAAIASRSEEAAREAYAADNKDAQAVERVLSERWGFDCDVFRIWA